MTRCSRFVYNIYIHRERNSSIDPDSRGDCRSSACLIAPFQYGGFFWPSSLITTTRETIFAQFNDSNTAHYYQIIFFPSCPLGNLRSPSTSTPLVFIVEKLLKRGYFLCFRWIFIRSYAFSIPALTKIKSWFGHRPTTLATAAAERGSTSSSRDGYICIYVWIMPKPLGCV